MKQTLFYLLLPFWHTEDQFVCDSNAYDMSNVCKAYDVPSALMYILPSQNSNYIVQSYPLDLITCMIET